MNLNEVMVSLKAALENFDDAGRGIKIMAENNHDAALMTKLNLSTGALTLLFDHVYEILLLNSIPVEINTTPNEDQEETTFVEGVSKQDTTGTETKDEAVG